MGIVEVTPIGVEEHGPVLAHGLGRCYERRILGLALGSGERAGGGARRLAEADHELVDLGRGLRRRILSHGVGYRHDRVTPSSRAFQVSTRSSR